MSEDATRPIEDLNGTAHRSSLVQGATTSAPSKPPFRFRALAKRQRASTLVRPLPASHAAIVPRAAQSGEPPVCLVDRTCIASPLVPD